MVRRKDLFGEISSHLLLFGFSKKALKGYKNILSIAFSF